MTRAAWMFIGLVALGACAGTTDHHDGGGLDAGAIRPTVDAGMDAAPPNDGATEARASDAGAADLPPLTP
jgi:hypothetical protein